MNLAVRVLCVALAIGGSASVAVAQSGRAIRFAAMDTDGNGVITRAEWRGSDQSFRVHDWNNDGVLSGDEVKPGARRPAGAGAADFDSADREYQITDWTAENFASLDHNKDGRLTADEWHFDRESFRRADHNGDGVVSRAEFLGEDREDDDREDRFSNLDVNRDERITKDEWHGDPARFTLLDDNKDGVLTRAEVLGTNEPPPDLFTSVDVNRDGVVTRGEWHWSRASFDARDANHDGRLSRQEFVGSMPPDRQNPARNAGYDRGLVEGRAAGKEDRERNQGWDLEGQRELETADSGYEPRMGAKAEYQAGYREGFRRGYREGWGQR